MKLNGKVAIITGAAAGIGFAAAKVFLQEGAIVAICDLKQETVEKAVKQLRELGTVRGFAVNITDKEGVDSMVSNIIEEFSIWE